MVKCFIKEAKNHDTFNFDKISKEDLTKEFILYYYDCLIKFICYENDIIKDEVYECMYKYDINKLSTTIRTNDLVHWFDNEGIKSFEYIVQYLSQEKLDGNARSFTKLYNYLLDKSISSINLDSLIDYLYYIPGVMKREYEKFGFLNEELKSISLNDDYYKRSNYILNTKFEESVKQIPCFA